MKSTVTAIIIGVVLITGALIFVSSSSSTKSDVADGHNVTIVNGKQIIEIHAKGGYQPRASLAKAGIPTILRFDTSGTFDCSSSVRLPSLNITKALPQSGTTDIDIGTPTVATLQGTCGMGMYPFQITFTS